MFKMYRVGNMIFVIKENMWILYQVVFTGYLLFLSVTDIRKRKLRLGILLAGFPIVTAVRLISRDIPAAILLAGAAVGITFLIISKATEEAFGYGDSILIMILGILLGFWSVLCLLVAAFFMAAVFSGIMLVKKRFTRKSSMPFVPFLTAAYIGGMLIGWY